MNFYIGNSIKEINIKDENVEFSDELLNYIYKICKKNHVKMNNKLHEIVHTMMS